jgi:hypothetical protein
VFLERVRPPQYRDDSRANTTPVGITPGVRQRFLHAFEYLRRDGEPAGLDPKTFAHALHYLETKRPRFLYIALDDTDSMGDAGDYDSYLDVMRNYDLWLRELDRVLLRMGKEGAARTSSSRPITGAAGARSGCCIA